LAVDVLKPVIVQDVRGGFDFVIRQLNMSHSPKRGI
jgi:hypothetical protein